MPSCGVVWRVLKQLRKCVRGIKGEMNMTENETLLNKSNFFNNAFQENKGDFERMLKLNLQHFAEEGEDGEEEKEAEQPETFTKSEVDSQISKSVAKALERKQAEFEAQLEEKLAAERKSAEEYAKMTAKEKEDAAYKQRLSELEKREQELNQRQLLTQVEADLKESGLPVSFASSLVAVGDNEAIKEALNAIKKDFDDAVNNAVKDKLRQDTPKTGGGIPGNAVTSIAELAAQNRIIKN